MQRRERKLFDLSILFSPEAKQDLIDLFDYIAAQDGLDRALAYIERIEAWCFALRTFPERGNRRDDIRPGLRLMGVERRASIAFHVSADSVLILRILYGGRDLESSFDSLLT